MVHVGLKVKGFGLTPGAPSTKTIPTLGSKVYK